MIIESQAPCRISLVGGGTDIEPYVSLYGGAVISFAINIRQKFTLFIGNDIYGVKNSVPDGCNLEFVYAFRDEFGVNSFHHSRFISESDGGLNSGIGSSAAVAVAIVGALAKSQNKTMTRTEIAEKAWQIETQKLGMFGGKQDQYAAAFGGANLFEFGNEVKVNPIDISKILSSIVLLHTNTIRSSPVIQEEFKNLTDFKKDALDELKSLINPTLATIEQGDIKTLGEILNETYALKKKSNYRTTNERIGNIYHYAKINKAYGGKICGAGDGGFMMFVVEPDRKKDFIHKMELYGLTNWNFDIDKNGLEVKKLTP